MTRGAPAGAPSFPVALVGPSSLLGRDVRAVLTERKFPASRVHLFQGAPGSAGVLGVDEDEAALVAPLEPDALDTIRVAFLCGSPAETAAFLETRVDDALAIDLSLFRNGQPLVVPRGEGDERPLPEGPLFLTPHPTAFVLAAAIRAVDAVAPVEGVTAAVDRPASELGKAALDELFEQAVALANFRPVPKDALGTQAAFNAWMPADARSFESRVAEDTTALLGRELPLAVLSARTGVFHGHLLRVELRLGADGPPADELLARFRARKNEFDVVDPEDFPGPVEAAGRDETLLLRCESSGRRVSLALASDHLRCAALLGVRLAEQAARERGWLGGPVVS